MVRMGMVGDGRERGGDGMAWEGVRKEIWMAVAGGCNWRDENEDGN